MANSPAFQPARTGTGSEAPILPISFGDEIGAGLVYSTGYGGSGAEDDSGHLGPGAAQFADGTPSYIGFALLREEDVFYGWMRVVLTRNGLDGLLQSWAYDDSGVAIRAAASADPGAAPVILQAGETQTATVATAGTALMLDAGAEFTFSENSTGGIYTGNIMGYGELKIAGNGSLSLSGTNTFSGGTTLSAGVLRLESATGAGTGTITQSDGTSTIEIDTTGTVANAMNFHNLSTLQTVTLSGNKTLNNSTYTVASGTTTTESGVLSGIGGITKEGAGTLLVTGNNTFSGATEVNAGVLDLASTVGGAAGAVASIAVSSGATWLPPEAREGRGAVAAGERLRRLVGLEDLVGALHCHSHDSDGHATLAEMAEAARARGLRYLGVSDHSQSSTYAGGLTRDAILRQHDEIDALNAAWAAQGADFRVLKGIEADILPCGRLDYDAAFLDRFDFVIGSVHARFGMQARQMTDRVLRALDDPHLTILGHPTGRLLLTREPYPLDLAAVAAKAAAVGVALELNADPHRLDLNGDGCRVAREAGALVSIGPDAHSPDGFDHLALGVAVARQGWLAPADVLNHRDADGVLAFARARRG